MVDGVQAQPCHCARCLDGSLAISNACRNCISNVRPAGLPYDEAADKLHWLLTEARRRELTGVGLKDDADDHPPALGGGHDPSHNFLLGH